MGSHYTATIIHIFSLLTADHTDPGCVAWHCEVLNISTSIMMSSSRVSGFTVLEMLLICTLCVTIMFSD